ncbi:MAG TPA: GtrA family protein [Anaerolineaceae bacterium]|nr:GtrA family protein [Anaerolineaceae bacterium]
MAEYLKIFRLRVHQAPLFLRQAVKFGMVGVLNTAVDLGVFFGLTHWVGFFSGAPTAAKAVSYSAGILNSFLWNRSWTFRASGDSWGKLLPFVLVNLIALGINTGLMQIGLRTLLLPQNAALALATCGTLALNFIANKYIVFRK